MKGPSYVWLCHKCGKPNQPHIDRCEFCGFPAVASVLDVDPDAEMKERKTRSVIWSNFWLFFPEGLIAGLVVLGTPFWALKLLLAGHFLAAVTLVSGMVACGYGFGWAVFNKLKYIAYLAMVCFLLLALIVDNLLT